MSTPTDGVTGPLAYAPKWARDAATVEKHNAAREHRVSTGNQEIPFGSGLAEARFSDGVRPTEFSPEAPSLDPVVLTPPPPRSLLRVGFAIAGGLAISAAAGAIATLFVMENLPSWGLVARGDRLGVTSFETRFVGQNAQTSNLDLFSYASQLASINIATQRENQHAHLTEPLRGVDHTSSTATDGASAPAPANEEPRLAEPLRGSTADQSSSTATDASSRSTLANETPRLAEPLPTRPLASDQIAAFLKRGQELVASGDITAAHVMLLRAAEARDPQAALALAATFDPIILERTRAYGVVPDVSSARAWYEKAKEFGSEEAPRRLEMLARREM